MRSGRVYPWEFKQCFYIYLGMMAIYVGVACFFVWLMHDDLLWVGFVILVTLREIYKETRQQMKLHRHMKGGYVMVFVKGQQ